MKLKYYLRGIGFGIIFSTIILTVAFYNSSKTTMTDDEIIEKAKELGMVYKEDEIDNLLTTITPTVTPSPTVAPTEIPVATPTVTPTVTPTITESKDDSVVESTDATASDETSDTTGSDVSMNNKDSVTIEIVNGMSSEKVANLLKEKGILEDAQAFNQYLSQNNYTKDIRIGKFEIKPYASYKNIADIIVSK